MTRAARQPEPTAPDTARRPGPIAGWLLFAAGLTLVVCAVLVPASDDLAEARWQRDKVLTLESYTLSRIERHEEFLGAVQAGDPDLARSLAAAQLNLVPVGRWALIAPGRPADTDLFGTIEPPPPSLPARPHVGSLLERLTTAEHLRLWVIAAGALLVLIGLLPPAQSR